MMLGSEFQELTTIFDSMKALGAFRPGSSLSHGSGFDML
jgi:hypothetical protein